MLRTYRAWVDRQWLDAAEQKDNVSRTSGLPRDPYWADGRPRPPSPPKGVHTVDSPAPARRGAGRLVAGVILLTLAGIGWWIPHVIFTVSVSQAHSLCGGAAGSFAQLLNAQARTACGNVGSATLVIALAAVAGGALTVWGIALRRSADR